MPREGMALIAAVICSALAAGCMENSGEKTPLPSDPPVGTNDTVQEPTIFLVSEFTLLPGERHEMYPQLPLNTTKVTVRIDVDGGAWLDLEFSGFGPECSMQTTSDAAAPVQPVRIESSCVPEVEGMSAVSLVSNTGVASGQLVAIASFE